MEYIFYITVGISGILLLCSVILALSKYKLCTKSEKWYIYYIIFIFCIEFTSYTISLIKPNTNNEFLYHIYIAGEFFVVTGIFIEKLNLNKYWFILTGVCSLFFLIGAKFLFHYHYSNDYFKAISNIIIICMTGFSLINDITTIANKITFQLLDKMIFLYFTVSIFSFMFQHQLLEFPVHYFSIIWIINNLMVCVMYGIFIITFLKLKNTINNNLK